MDLLYDATRFHGFIRARHDNRTDSYGATDEPLKATWDYGSLSHTAKQLARHPLETATDVVTQGVRLQFNAISSTAYFARHPLEAFDTAKGIALHPLHSFNTIINTLFQPTAAGQDDGDVSGHMPLALADDFHRDIEPISQDILSVDDLVLNARLTRLNDEIQRVETQEDFLRIANALGELDGFESWRHDEHPAYRLYDVQRIQARSNGVRTAMGTREQREMVQLIRTHLCRYLGEADNPELFLEKRIGTKALIEQYADSICDLLEESTESHYGETSDRAAMREQLKLTRQAFGRTALLLSGGGTLGMQQIGVIKALYESGSLPRIVCGSSAGAIVCSILCTKQGHEIETVLDSFCNGDLKVFVGDDEQQGILARIVYFLKRGHLFNANNLRRVMKYHLGDLTFAEAYRKTGRILNITVSSANTYESIRLLNYATTGDVLIWSAVVASCALPFGYEPSPLMHKDRRGNIERWDEHTLHLDGSIDGDLPFDKVSAIFNVNQFIVSQVNPHVTPFLEGRSEPRNHCPTFWEAIIGSAKDELTDWLHPEVLPLFANLRRKASFIVGQRYTGDITILPKDSTNLFLNVLSNPTIPFMQEASRNGELATWVKLNRIKNLMRIEAAIDNAVKKAEEITSFSRSQSDLRRMELETIRRMSLSGRRPPRPGSSGHQSTKSAITPGCVQQRHERADRLSVQSFETHFDVLGNSATKVAGDQASLSSASSKSRASFSLGSDGEGFEPEVPLRSLAIDTASQPLVTLTAPSSPTQSFRTLVSLPSRSANQTVASRAPPASDYSKIPKPKTKQRFIGPMKPMTAVKPLPPPPTPPSPRQASPTNERKPSGRQSGFDRFTRKLSRKRSLSAGG